MSKNLDLARECGAELASIGANIGQTCCGILMTNDQLDAFAERIRAEAKADALEPSGERAALIKRLRDYVGCQSWELARELMSDAADMLAADAQEQAPMFWVRLCSDGGYEGPIPNASIEKVRRRSGAWKPLFLKTPALHAQEQEPSTPMMYQISKTREVYRGYADVQLALDYLEARIANIGADK